MTAPVVLLVFNRPDLTSETFAAIRAARPRVLLVVADGPRQDRTGEMELCSAARQVAEGVDWPCEVHRNYAETNMGCGRRVSTGISWAFEFVEEAIILEDDCVPSGSFFGFCHALLERYRDDERIMHVSGTNMAPAKLRGEASYRFSKYPHIWGWATWRRAWKRYDVLMDAWRDYRNSKAFAERCPHRLERQYWTYYFDRMTSGDPIDTWDYQWTFACWLVSGLAVSPSVNMVTNVGYRADGTHTVDESPWANMSASEIGQLSHPPRVEADRRADWWEFVHHYGGEWYREQMRLRTRLRRLAGPARSALRRVLRR